MGLVSGWSLANHSNSVFPGGARIAQPRWMLVRGILGSGRTRGVSFIPLPNSSGWWWLISSVFLIRISCHKTTYANGYYGAWPGWAVSISVLPLTILNSPVIKEFGSKFFFFLADEIIKSYLLRWLKLINNWRKTDFFIHLSFKITFPPFVFLLIRITSLKLVFQRDDLDKNS